MKSPGVLPLRRSVRPCPIEGPLSTISAHSLLNVLHLCINLALIPSVAKQVDQIVRLLLLEPIENFTEVRDGKFKPLAMVRRAVGTQRTCGLRRRHL